MATKKRKKKATNTVAVSKNHTISIVVNNDVIKYKHDPGNDDGRRVYVEPGDTVKWRGSHRFMVLFAKNGSPFNEIIFGGLANGDSATGVVRPSPGTYSYFVTVITDNGVIPDDPDIIVT